MEAKDTVMTDEQLVEIYALGQQAGVQEVVDWIDRNRSVFASTFFNPEVETFSLFCDKETWKAQLRKWGIK